MLIRFAVENFMSFKDRQIISMVAAKHTRHSDHISNIENRRILKAGFLFGANASGKSNLLKAVNSARMIALDGLQDVSIERMYFRIDPEYSHKPGSFQFDIFSNGAFYSYGFAFSYIDRTILSEWLYRINGNSEVCIFERNTDNGISAVSSDLKFTDEDTAARFRIYGKDVSRTNTFLREICSKELLQLDDFSAFRDVWQWLKHLIIIFPETHINPFGWYNAMADDSVRKQISSFDTGIKDIHTEYISPDSLFDTLPPQIRDKFEELIEKDLTTSRTGVAGMVINGNRYIFRKKGNKLIAQLNMMDHGNSMDLFSFSDESDGTKRLFDLLPILSSAFENAVIFIDEIDRSFHTKLIIEFIELFYRNTKGKHMQLFATLHDVNVMNLNILRQDEILFIMRHDTGNSEIYSLNKFQVRFDKDVMKDYLLGRYGSIPVFSQLDDIKELNGE